MQWTSEGLDSAILRRLFDCQQLFAFDVFQLTVAEICRLLQRRAVFAEVRIPPLKIRVSPCGSRRSVGFLCRLSMGRGYREGCQDEGNSQDNGKSDTGHWNLLCLLYTSPSPRDS